MEPNAIVEYISETTRAVLEVDRFYDPGLDPTSDYSREWMKRTGKPFWPHMAYGCGRAL